MHSWLNFNGNFVKEGMPVVTANNRGLRYGDGVFETIKCMNGQIRHKKLHFERLVLGIDALRIQLPSQVTTQLLEEEIVRTLEKNRIRDAARVRLMVFRGDGGLYELDGGGGGYIIQVWSLPEGKQEFNENGLMVCLYDEAWKPCDSLANLKTNNYLVYAMAAIHAKENKCNDSLVLNIHGRICDASIANVFWVKNGKVFTPPLSEGCIAGVMRRHLLESGHGIIEQPCTIKDIESADEVFLTNSVAGLRWVQQFGDKTYGNTVSKKLYFSTI